MVLIADHERRGQAWQPLKTLLGLLQQGVSPCTGQRPVLLRVAGAGEGPKAGARTSAEDHRHKAGSCG